MAGDVDLKVVLHRLDAVDKTLERITESVDRLVRVEERQTHTNAAVERAFSQIKEQDKRVSAIELKLPDVTRTSVWVDRAAVFVLTAVGMLALKKMGLL